MVNNTTYSVYGGSYTDTTACWSSREKRVRLYLKLNRIRDVWEEQVLWVLQPLESTVLGRKKTKQKKRRLKVKLHQRLLIQCSQKIVLCIELYWCVKTILCGPSELHLVPRETSTSQRGNYLARTWKSLSLFLFYTHMKSLGSTHNENFYFHSIPKLHFFIQQ